MTEDSATAHGEPIASLLAVLDDPAEGRRRLPRLFGLLDADEETVRVGASWAICHVVATYPDTVAYLTRRLADRLSDEEPALEAELVFEYVAARYPETVADELDDIETEAANRPRFSTAHGSLARSNCYLPDIGDRNVGRTRLADESGSVDTQQVYADDGERVAREDPSVLRIDDEDTPDDGDASDDGATADEPVDEAGSAADESGSAIAAGDETTADSPGSSDWKPADELPTIVYQSRFDQLTVLSKRRRGRYADVYRTLGVVDGDQLPVGLALFHRPSESREAFATDLSEQLGRWAGVCDHDNVVALHDWGVDPRPWAAAGYARLRLDDRDRFDLTEALWNAREIAGAVEHVHENGVVHGGIDPGNVVYYGNVMTEDERQPPLLTNVGLLHVVRRHFDPTTRLDPRYAAPEYFDRQFGRIDHATDVYQLGAVLYRLFTGRPPYDGDYRRIRRRVLSDPPPRPGDVVDVPPGIDDVVTKAMARQKLRRYETVTHLEQELRGVGADTDDNDR